MFVEGVIEDRSIEFVSYCMMAEFGDVFRVVTFIPMHAYEHKSTKIPMHGALSIWLRV